MGQVSRERDHRSAGAPKRQVAKTLGGAKPAVAKTTRQTLHLDEQVVERLGVHCSLTHRDRSSVANEILTTYLARYGRGREIFESPASGNLDDRQSEGPEVNSPDAAKT
jgi:hypothetical protein